MIRLKGLNLGCFLEYEETFNEKINLDEIIKTLKKKDMNAIRILISIKLMKNEDYKAILYNVIDKITSNKMYCIITLAGHDMYADDSWISFKEMLKDDYTKSATIVDFGNIWLKFSESLRHKDEYIIYEPFNEIHDGQWGHGFNLFDNGKSYEIINMLNYAFLESLKISNKFENIIVKPYCQQLDKIIFLDKKYKQDKNLYVGTAYYGSDFHFSIRAEKSLSIKQERKYVKDSLRILKTCKNVLFTEIGCSTDNSTKEIYEYFKILNKNFFKKYSYMIWDDGNRFKYIDRTTGEWLYEWI